MIAELAAEIFTEVKNGQTLERLDVEEASRISRNACVSPCSLVVALLYVERLKDCNPEYLQRVAPSELFLVSLVCADFTPFFYIFHIKEKKRKVPDTNTFYNTI